MKMQDARLSVWQILIAAVALGYATADAKNLVRVVIPDQDIQDPLYVDADSIRWNGNVVQFKYVLDVPILGNATAATRRHKSTEVEAVIDCVRQTISTGDVITYSALAATGDMTGGFTATDEEKRPIRIDMRKYSTYGYLFRHLCKPAGANPKKSR